MLVTKFHSGISKTKAAPNGLVGLTLFWNSHCAIYLPACMCDFVPCVWMLQRAYCIQKECCENWILNFYWHVLKPKTTKQNDRNETTETIETSAKQLVNKWKSLKKDLDLWHITSVTLLTSQILATSVKNWNSERRMNTSTMNMKTLRKRCIFFTFWIVF